MGFHKGFRPISLFLLAEEAAYQITMIEEDTTATDLESTLNLEEQLQVAISLANSLKEENASLSRELKDAREFSLKSQERQIQTRESWRRELAVVEKREQELQHEENQWKNRLEERKSEIDALERKYASLADKALPESYKSDVIKRIEHEYNSKLNCLEDEVNKWRESYYNTRQSYEEQKAKSDESLKQIENEREARDALQKVNTMAAAQSLHYLQTNINYSLVSRRQLNLSRNHLCITLWSADKSIQMIQRHWCVT